MIFIRRISIKLDVEFETPQQEDKVKKGGKSKHFQPGVIVWDYLSFFQNSWYLTYLIEVMS